MAATAPTCTVELMSAASATPSGGQPNHAEADEVLACELLEATFAHLRGQAHPCHPGLDQSLLAAAQTLLSTARTGEGTLRWKTAWISYLEALALFGQPSVWPSVAGLSQASRRHLEAHYSAAVAGFRERSGYAVVTVADLPAPINPFRCGHSERFEAFLARRRSSSAASPGSGPCLRP